MANLSLYLSGQTEQADVAEFFQKRLMEAGENPIAFFEGVFYESHQERVGNIAYQDYLVYSDKAVYLWARGSSKDFLDRFDLGSVSVNSRNKDRDFSTLNFKVRRENKEPVYVIFDMVERREAELITRLHTIVESIIEENLGVDFRKALPDPVATMVLKASRSVCAPQSVAIRLDVPDPGRQESTIGYGQDLLEQYKINLGYPSEQPDQDGQPAKESKGEGFSAADALKNLEQMLPTDPASLMRVAESIKEMIGDAPFKLRDQVKNDLQHVPGMLTAINELVNSIADNPQAERFVMNIIKTAVKNDGVIGSVGKLLKLSSTFGEPPRKRSQRPSSRSGASDSRHDAAPPKARGYGDDDDSGATRKKIKIKADDASVPAGTFAPDPEPPRDVSSPADETGYGRKRISIQNDDDEMSDLVKNMMGGDDVPDRNDLPDDFRSSGNGSRKRIVIRPDSEADSDPFSL